MNFEKNIHFALLSAIFVLLVVVPNLIWLNLDTLPPSWDQAHHTRMCIEFFKIFSANGFFDSVWQTFRYGSYYPPFFYFSSVPVLKIFGVSVDAVVYTHFFYAPVLLVGAYLFGAAILSPTAGVLVATSLALTPIVYGMSRQALLDFPLLSLVTFIFGAAISLHKKQNFILWVLLSLALAAAFLTKWTSILFIVPPLLYLFIVDFKKVNIRRSAILAILFAVILSLPWYYINRETIIAGVTATFKSGAVEGDPAGILESLYFILQTAFSVWMIPEFFIHYFIGVLLFVRCFPKKQEFNYILFCMLPAVLFFTFFPNKDPRYWLPVLSPLIVMKIVGFLKVSSKNIRCLLIESFIILATYTFVKISFFKPPYFPSYTTIPKREDWRVIEVLQQIEKTRNKRPTKIAFLPEQAYVNNNTYGLYVSYLGLPYEFEDIGVASKIENSLLDRFDVFITKSTDLSVPFLAKFKDMFHKEFMGNSPKFYGFQQLFEEELPDNSKLQVFIRTPNEHENH